MKNLSIQKSLFIVTSSFFILSRAYSQDCSVDKQELKGTYTGDCKKGKASGKGKAVGTDTYEGDFKNGLPDGDGVYTWANKNIYNGHFSKGSRDGKGTMTFKKENAKDSVVDGYWKNDAYIGKYEHPYTVFFKSGLVDQMEIEYKKDNFNQITFFVENTSGGGVTMGGEMPKMKVDDIQLTTGHYGRLTYNFNHAKKTETILTQVTYPTRMKVIMGRESVEIEFREPGSYTLNIHINN